MFLPEPSLRFLSPPLVNDNRGYCYRLECGPPLTTPPLRQSERVFAANNRYPGAHRTQARTAHSGQLFQPIEQHWGDGFQQRLQMASARGLLRIGLKWS